MYRTKSGEEIFVIDGHTHLWDGSPANQKNIHGKQFIECFYAYHSNLSPPSEKWPKDKFEKYDAKTMYDDLFIHGYDDMAILQPTYLTDFYKNGFNTTEQNSAIKKSHPERFILNGAFDPRDGNKGIEELHAKCEKYHLKGVKLYTAEWRGESKGYKLTDKESYKFVEAAQKYGIKNLHVHKGPTIIPLNRDAFDVADIDDIVPGPQLHRRALWPAAPRRLLLDRDAGDQRLRRVGGGAALHPHAPALFRSCDGGAALLAWTRQAALRQRLRHLDAQMADRQIHGVRDSRRPRQGDRLVPDARKQDENSRPQCRAPLRYRRFESEEENPSGRRIRASVGGRAPRGVGRAWRLGPSRIVAQRFGIDCAA